MMAPTVITSILWNSLIFVLLVSALTQVAADCDSKATCGECIQTPSCQWCSKTSGSKQKGKGKCFSDDVSLDDQCEKTTSDYVENPKNNLTLIRDDDLTEANSKVDSSQKLVQLKPQRIKLRLRKDVPINITLKYRQAQDYPVDLYYLMDLSRSMTDDKETVANLGSRIVDTLKSHTKQVRIGFGSFVDKVLLPFVDMSPAKLKSPCEDCARPYSFRNDLPLTNNTASFKERVGDIKMSGNMDSPEGGFDALMQVMKCTDEIKWSPNARRIIVFSTDAKFHSAGDGRLAGIIERNDEQCHLNDQGEYTHYMKMDYPSIAQINKVAKEEQVNIIFAVSSYENLYELLSNEIYSSTNGKLESGSDNVVQLVDEQYQAISSKVQLNYNGEDIDDALAIEYFARCKSDGPVVKSGTCDKVKEGDEIKFTLQVTLQKCPNERNFTAYVDTTQEKLFIEVETLCDCNCQKENHVLRKPYACTGAGDRICGVCECHDGYYGDVCQCSNQKHSNSTSNENCMKDEMECSGHGFCDCGKCQCYTGYDGYWCQCDRQACYTSTSNIACSGQGECKCDKCDCNKGYEGDKCECEDDNVCIRTGESEKCSGEGECVCGECRCKDGRSGRFCEDCPACGTGKCQIYKDCVQYKGFSSGEIENDDDFKKKCSDFETNIHKVDSLKSELDKNATLCNYNDVEDGCAFNFTYRYIKTGIQKYYKISINKIKSCPDPPNLLAIVLSVVATIVAIGLLTLLLWKVITTIHDRKEFENFEAERKDAQWNTSDNPIYKSTNTTIQNPGYGQEC